MKFGTYGGGNTKFNKLALNKCKLTFWDSLTYGKAGCGATALGLLTGNDPFEIRGQRKHFSDRFMVDYLRKNGFSVYEVNRANLSNKKEWGHSIQDNNLLLFSMLIQKKECSWMVMYGDSMLVHNFQVMKANYLDFLNFPVDSMYVLFKKGWK